MLMAAAEGWGTLKIANWRLRRLGMSFLPPPGTFMAATYLLGILLKHKAAALLRNLLSITVYVKELIVTMYNCWQHTLCPQ